MGQKLEALSGKLRAKTYKGHEVVLMREMSGTETGGTVWKAEGEDIQIGRASCRERVCLYV